MVNKRNAIRTKEAGELKEGRFPGPTKILLTRCFFLSFLFSNKLSDLLKSQSRSISEIGSIVTECRRAVIGAISSIDSEVRDTYYHRQFFLSHLMHCYFWIIIAKLVKTSNDFFKAFVFMYAQYKSMCRCIVDGGEIDLHVRREVHRFTVKQLVIRVFLICVIIHIEGFVLSEVVAASRKVLRGLDRLAAFAF